MQGLLDLTHSKLRPTELAGFFWRHLEHDIGILGKAVGKSEDDVCLLLHLILRKLATKTPAQCQAFFLFGILFGVSMIAVYLVSTASSMQEYASLLSTNAREQWEKSFDQEYIEPVLSVS